MRPRSTLGAIGPPLLVGVIGFAVTAATTAAFLSVQSARTRARIEREADRAIDHIEDCLQANIALLNGAAGLFSGSESVTDEEFSHFVVRMQMVETFPSALGIGFARWCPTQEQASSLRGEMSRRLGREVEAGPEGAGPQVVIEQLEPGEQRKVELVGKDIWSLPDRREALSRARDEGAAAATEPVTLIQDVGDETRAGFLIFVPVYSGGAIPRSLEERRGSISGWVYSPFRVRDLMAQVFRGRVAEGLALTITDASAGVEVFTSPPSAGGRLPNEPHRFDINVAGRIWTVEIRSAGDFRGPEASAAWVAATCGLLLTGAGMWMAVIRGRARRRVEAAADRLAVSNERYASLVAATASIVWTSDADGCFTESQASWEAYTGQPWEVHGGRGWVEALHTADRELVRTAWDRARADGTPFEVEGRIWSAKSSSHRWFVMRGVPIFSNGRLAGWVGLVQDTQDRRALEETLLQSRKLESLGRLAGGIAHDFNNLLTAIVGSAELAGMERDVPPGVRDHLMTIREAAHRSGVLTSHLLAFARKQVIEPRNVAVNEMVNGLAPILRRLLGENIELLISLGEETGRTRIDPGQFEQVLVNLAANSRDAMPHGGLLTIQTSNADLDDEYARTHEGVAPGPYVMLLVSDTGVGMDESVQSHIFEPFFTTKENGKGTGLGLATCYGIIRQAGGSIWVYSEPGKGTLFRIFLPRADAAEEAAAPAPDDTPGFGRETVLLVEDEPMVRQIAAVALRGYGYSVMAAGSAEEALALANAFAGEIHLLLTDVVLPQAGGKDLAERIRGRRPAIRVLFCSGYTDNIISRHGVLHGGVAFLQKPYTPRQLARKVRAVLDSAAVPRPA